MKIPNEQQEFLIHTIREILALNPRVSVRKLQALVEKNTGRSISDKYLLKLREKIRRRNIVESDRTKLNERYAEVKERNRMLCNTLLCTIYWKPEFLFEHGIKRPEWKEKQQAIKLLAQIDIAFFRTELEIGLYQDRQAAIHEMLKQGILPNELHEQVVKVFAKWKNVEPEKADLLELK